MDVHPTKNVSIGIDPYPNIIMILHDFLGFRHILCRLTLEETSRTRSAALMLHGVWTYSRFPACMDEERPWHTKVPSI
jgi:hypothetical protein